jgi:MFS family permease
MLWSFHTPSSKGKTSGPSGFRRLLAAQTGTSLGESLLLAAFPLIALHVTRSPVLISSVTLSTTLPWAIVSLPSGLLVDRFERRRTMGAACAAASAALAALALALAHGVDSVILLDLVGFFVGSLQIIVANGGSALLPQVTDPGSLTDANAKLFAAQGLVGELFGPPLAGILVTVGLALPVAGAMCSYMLAVIVLWSWQQTFRAVTSPVRWPEIHRDLSAGLVILMRHRQLRTFCAMTALLNVAGQAVWSVLVLYAVSPGPMNLSKTGYGILLAVYAAGGIFGARLAGPLTQMSGRGALLTATIVVMAITLGAPALWAQPVAVATEFFINGGVSAIYNIITVSYRQRVVQSALLGRVTASYRIFSFGALPVGAALGGLAAHLFGVDAVFSLGALVIALSAVGLPSVKEQLLKATETAAGRAGTGG